jgi:hypothetical protein
MESTTTKRGRKPLPIEERAANIKKSISDFHERNPEKANQYALKSAHKRRDRLGRMQCPCGGNFMVVNQSSHIKTKKHVRFLDQTVAAPLELQFPMEDQ